MADVFISYAKDERALTETLVAALEEAGYTVWWDKHLHAGKRFSKAISAEIDDCAAAVIIWTPTSIDSEWVESEADHARRSGKLINTFGNGLKPTQIPKPFDRFHAVPADDHAEIIRAIKELRPTHLKTALPKLAPRKTEDFVSDEGFLDDTTFMFGELAAQLRDVAAEDYKDEKAYTHRLVTAADMLAETVDPFIAKLPLKGLTYTQRVRLTAIEADIKEVKRTLDKERDWLTKRFSSAVLSGARNDLTWVAETLLKAIKQGS
jgi:hypothetical protein